LDHFARYIVYVILNWYSENIIILLKVDENDVTHCACGMLTEYRF